ncbi:hypothetical protein CBS115989_2708 [Aspergillus niger]|nr:hypothetical protein CBS115989_2708 [Aspergillus niger]KAI2831396.1 hypothetical protein CBS133816_2616 [Aspergillus niger]KAI2841331.1 hypothetical protein CBS11350_6499 [Aspergillus niger]KAI2857373.1 hypothetical protein CBS11232_3147 [Aspergillus niger]KAI2875617.1 hypothetical protein CBS115988_5238 [Aspergillus niger]
MYVCLRVSRAGGEPQAAIGKLFSSSPRILSPFHLLLQHLPIREELNYKAEIDWINTLCLDHHDGCS